MNPFESLIADFAKLSAFADAAISVRAEIAAAAVSADAGGGEGGRSSAAADGGGPNGDVSGFMRV